MIFVVDANGSVTKIGANSIYQGSVRASQIILLAPLPSSLSVTVGFTLPNGKNTSVNLATLANMAEINLQGIMTDTEAKNYNAWVHTLQAEVTEYAGTVRAQFFCYTATSEVLTTYACDFEVFPGVAVELPATPTQTIYDQILTALAQANAKITELGGKLVIREVTGLPIDNVDTQSIYVLHQDAMEGPQVYIYSEVQRKWLRLDDAIIPITYTAQADSNLRKLYMVASGPNAGIYAFVGDVLKRLLDIDDYTALNTAINSVSTALGTAQSTANEALSTANTALNTATQASTSASNANSVALRASNNASEAKTTANTANANAEEAVTKAEEAFAKAEEALNSATAVLTFKASIDFFTLVLTKIPSASTVNGIYNITDAFTTTSLFVEGAGKSYPAGTNVAIVQYNGAYKYDVLAGFVDTSNLQEKLVSGENIKTVNGASILGSGDITVEGTQGAQGEAGVGIANITVGNPVVGSEYTTTPLTITFTDGASTTVNASAKNGEKGANGTNGTNGTDGVGIENIAKTATSGLVDTYTITLTNGATTTFTVTNGAQGIQGVQGAQGVQGMQGEQGEKGADGVGVSSVTAGTPTESNGYTVTPITVTKTDNTSDSFNILAKNGADGKDGTDGANGTNGTNGEDGVGIASVTAGTPTESGDNTVTPITITKTDGSSNTLYVQAKNGEQGIQGAQGVQGEQGVQGVQGVGISNITSGTPTISGDYTVTPITFTKTNNQATTLNIQAKNGADGGSGITTLTTQTVRIQDLAGGVYLWDYEGDKTLDWYDGTETIYSNPVLLQISDYTYDGYACKSFYLVDCSGYPESSANAIVYGTMYIDDGELEGYCQRKYLDNIPDSYINANNIVHVTGPQTITGDKTFTGTVDFTNANVTGLSVGLTKTKITLAQLKSIMATTTFAGDLISIVVKYTDGAIGINYLIAAISDLGGVFSIALNTSQTKCTIDAVTGYTTISESEIYALRNSLNITSTAAYVYRNSYSYDISNATLHDDNSNSVNLTDNNCDFYIITDKTSSIPQ